MITAKDTMLKMLTEQPLARERRYKNKAIAFLLSDQYNTQMGVGVKKLEDIIVDAATLDRAWRQIMQEHPSLRGKDYKDKELLEQERQIELGYEPGTRKLPDHITDQG